MKLGDLGTWLALVNNMIPGPGLTGCSGDGSGGVRSRNMISGRLVVLLVGGSCWEEETGFSFLLHSYQEYNSRALAGIAAARRSNAHISYTLFQS